MRLLIPLTALCWALAVRTARGQPGLDASAGSGGEVSRIAEVMDRIEALEHRSPIAPDVRSAIQQARVAVEIARRARGEGRWSRAAWAEQLACASASLAESRAARARESHALRAAVAQRERARARAASAREALSVAKERR